MGEDHFDCFDAMLGMREQALGQRGEYPGLAHAHTDLPQNWLHLHLLLSLLSMHLEDCIRSSLLALTHLSH